jgi:hypothetical protein
VWQDRSEQTEADNQQRACARFQSFGLRMKRFCPVSKCGTSDDTYYA